MVQTKVSKTEAFALFLSKQEVNEKHAGLKLHRTRSLRFL